MGTPKNDFSLVHSQIDTLTSVPFLTKQKSFIYVDKETLNPISDQEFVMASLYTSTGFAGVENQKGENGIINKKGNLIVDFSDGNLNLNVVNGLTFYSKKVEYEKKMPFWKWEWNILGGSIKKEQRYHKIEIGVLETRQILLRKDIPYDEDNYYINFDSVDQNHLFWNNTLYTIKKRRLKVLEREVLDVLASGRFIKSSTSTFSIYDLDNKKSVYRGLQGTYTLSVKVGTDTVLLDGINKERYTAEVPKLLLDEKTNDVYAFPKYEKIFPKEIRNATQMQADFIKRTSLVYSITNSPYFLLGAFNFDDDVRAFDWLYVDTSGYVLDAIGSYNFKVIDQVGNLVWPDRKIILPDKFVDKNWKFGKINFYSGMDSLYLIYVEKETERRTMGLWNSAIMTWEINPDYHRISVLDTQREIYALQEHENDCFTLYDNKRKGNIGAKTYQSINSDGLVSMKDENGQTIYYYIDIYTGEEYIEN